VAGADAGAGGDQQSMLGQEVAELVDDRQDRLGAAIHDRAASDLYDLQPSFQTTARTARIPIEDARGS
jgi:hypothetical protein